MAKKSTKAAGKVKRDAAEARSMAKHTDALSQLAPLAKEISVRFEKVAELGVKADDHRLAAALRMAEAEAIAKKAGIRFRAWFEKNVTGQSFETARKLLQIGREGEAGGAKLLADMRTRQKKVSKAHRERKSEETKKALSVQPGVQFMVALDKMPEGQAKNAIQSAAETRGFKLVKAGEEPKKSVGIEAVKAAFQALKASERMAFLEWGASQVGARLDLTGGVTGQTAGEKAVEAYTGDGIPEAMKRSDIKPGQAGAAVRRRRSNGAGASAA